MLKLWKSGNDQETKNVVAWYAVEVNVESLMLDIFFANKLKREDQC